MLLSAFRKIALFALVGMPLALPAQASTAGTSAADAVKQFMRALTDSNLTRMGELFGNAKGPVVKTRPEGYEKKIVIMQLTLHGVVATTLGDVPGKNNMRRVTTQLSNHGCKVTIPIDVVKAPEGWLVWGFDLQAAQEVNKPCEGSGRPGTGGM